MSIYFFVTFEVHYTVSRYDVCLENYMDQSLRLIPKALMAFLEFQSRSHGMSLEPNFFIFLGLNLLFEIYSGM